MSKRNNAGKDATLNDIYKTINCIGDAVLDLKDRVESLERHSTLPDSPKHNNLTGWVSPFANHDNFDEVPEAQLDPSILHGIYFREDGAEFDDNIALKIYRGGLYYRKDEKFTETKDIHAPVFIGSPNHVSGIYIPNIISYKGSIAARNFFQSLIDNYETGEIGTF